VFSDDEAPTLPVNPSGPLMTVPQIRDAVSAFPPEQQPLIIAMLRGADDNGFLRGAARLTRVGPFEHHPASERPVKAPAQRKGKR
jgi:hypothetical protein